MNGPWSCWNFLQSTTLLSDCYGAAPASRIFCLLRGAMRLVAEGLFEFCAGLRRGSLPSSVRAAVGDALLDSSSVAVISEISVVSSRRLAAAVAGPMDFRSAFD